MKNTIKLSGIISQVKDNFEVHGRKFCEIELSVQRASGAVDTLNVVYYANAGNFKVNDRVSIEGTLRSRNVINDDKLKLIVYAFANKINTISAEEADTNEVTVEGYICKPIVTRKTPSGLILSDILIAINQGKKSYYIPVIMFGSEAVTCSIFSTGDAVEITGRFQSRSYIKKLSETESETRVAYELAGRAISLATIE